jgi:hypothetical protein
LPNAVVVGENGRAELLDLGGEKDGFEIGGVDCAIRWQVSCPQTKTKQSVVRPKSEGRIGREWEKFRVRSIGATRRRPREDGERWESDK